MLGLWFNRGMEGVRIALVLFAGAALVVYLTTLSGKTRLEGAAIAIDGDSLRVEGQEVRLEGIDAPEFRQVCERPDGFEVPCGKDARSALAALLAKGPVRCLHHGHDRFGRNLAICSVGPTDINGFLVRSGHAIGVGRYAAEEAEARQAGRGIWGTLFERPSDYRAGYPGSVQ